MKPNIYATLYEAVLTRPEILDYRSGFVRYCWKVPGSQLYIKKEI